MRIVGANPLLVDLGQAPTGDVLEGEATMTELVLMLRTTTGRIVVDETGLKGTYRVAMKFDMAATRLGPALMPGRETGVPNVFAAIQQQLGLKLESTRVPTDTLVIGRLERPTEN